MTQHEEYTLACREAAQVKATTKAAQRRRAHLKHMAKIYGDPALHAAKKRRDLERFRRKMRAPGARRAWNLQQARGRRRRMAALLADPRAHDAFKRKRRDVVRRRLSRPQTHRRYNAYHKAYAAEGRRTLTDAYVKRVLRVQGLPVPQVVLEAKRLQIRLQRATNHRREK